MFQTLVRKKIGCLLVCKKHLGDLSRIKHARFFDAQLDFLVKALEDCEAECGSDMSHRW